jgi:hypothetical protein
MGCTCTLSERGAPLPPSAFSQHILPAHSPGTCESGLTRRHRRVRDHPGRTGSTGGSSDAVPAVTLSSGTHSRLHRSLIGFAVGLVLAQGLAHGTAGVEPEPRLLLYPVREKSVRRVLRVVVSE